MEINPLKLLIMESISFIQWCLDNLNYWTVTLLMTIESSFIPFPSEIVVPPAAYKAAAGELNVFGVVLAATVGANLGAIINYYLALWVGRPIVHKFANSRIGHMCLLTEESVIRSEEYFNKNGAVSTFIGRLIPGIRQLISIPAGLARMGLPTFIFYTTLGAGIWNAVLAAIGYYLHAIVPKDQLMEKVMEYSREISVGIVIIVVFIVGFLLFKALKKGK